MPCSDGGPSHDQIEAAEKRLEITTRLACEYMTMLESQKCVLPKYAIEWWEEHKRWDAERLAQEQADRKREQTQQQTVAELKARFSKEQLASVGLFIK